LCIALLFYCRKANKERDAVVEELAEYAQLKSAIDAIKVN
jgi:hypothetical protein